MFLSFFFLVFFFSIFQTYSYTMTKVTRTKHKIQKLHLLSQSDECLGVRKMWSSTGYLIVLTLQMNHERQMCACKFLPVERILHNHTQWTSATIYVYISWLQNNNNKIWVNLIGWFQSYKVKCSVTMTAAIRPFDAVFYPLYNYTYLYVIELYFKQNKC